MYKILSSHSHSSEPSTIVGYVAQALQTFQDNNTPLFQKLVSAENKVSFEALTSPLITRFSDLLEAKYPAATISSPHHSIKTLFSKVLSYQLSRPQLLFQSFTFDKGSRGISNPIS